jgi:hypothetical protein
MAREQFSQRRERARAKELPDAALDHFFELFSPTLKLVEHLVASRSNPQEILILLCARLDGLASSSVSEDTSNKQAFVHFLSSYSSQRDIFESVSVGDLYYELAYHRWMLEGTIPKPGRIHRYSRVDDPIIRLLEDSGMPLMVRDAEAFLGRIQKSLRKHFRVMPSQRLAKPALAKVKRVEEVVLGEFRGRRSTVVIEALPNALQPLLDAKRMATILHEKFRSQAIHGAQVLLNESRFFSDEDPYWEPKSSPYFGSYCLVEFPAKFLVTVLRNSLKTYRAHLLAKGKFPPDVHSHVFGDEVFRYIEFLDEAALPKGGELKLQAKGR